MSFLWNKFYALFLLLIYSLSLTRAREIFKYTDEQGFQWEYEYRYKKDENGEWQTVVHYNGPWTEPQKATGTELDAPKYLLACLLMAVLIVRVAYHMLKTDCFCKCCRK